MFEIPVGTNIHASKNRRFEINIGIVIVKIKKENMTCFNPAVLYNHLESLSGFKI